MDNLHGTLTANRTLFHLPSLLSMPHTNVHTSREWEGTQGAWVPSLNAIQQVGPIANPNLPQCSSMTTPAHSISWNSDHILHSSHTPIVQPFPSYLTEYMHPNNVFPSTMLNNDNMPPYQQSWNHHPYTYHPMHVPQHFQSHHPGYFVPPYNNQFIHPNYFHPPVAPIAPFTPNLAPIPNSIQPTNWFSTVQPFLTAFLARLDKSDSLKDSKTWLK